MEYCKTNYWKVSVFLLAGILIGLGINYFKPKSDENKLPVNKIELIIVEKDSNSVNKDSVKIKKKVIVNNTLPPLTKENLKKELIKQGIKHHKIVLAQAKLESNYGKSKVAKDTNNLFGLRKGKRYRRFSHWTESVTAYKNLIQSRYSGGNYYKFLDRIGYAEDDAYIIKLKALV